MGHILGGFPMNKDTLILAHYYTTPDVQVMADHVGDSLELALIAQREQPKRIVFAGVRFMAETVKLLLPEAEVVLPDAKASCSLVEQTNTDELRKWREDNAGATHVMYINSSAEQKALADWIVTSRNVDDIVRQEINSGHDVIFSPDRNMGSYLNYQNDWNIKVWHAVCEVHDKFKMEEIRRVMNHWTDGPKYLLAHPESPLPVLEKADFVGSTSKMLQWVKDYEFTPFTRAQIYVATEEGLLYNMRQARPDLDIIQAPTYTGCQCNACPYMKTNTADLVLAAVNGTAGVKIDYLSASLIEKARKPVERMIEFSKG